MKDLQVFVVDVILLAYLGHRELLVQLYDKNDLWKIGLHGKTRKILLRLWLATL